MKTIILSKPIEGLDGQLFEITLREPLVGDIIKIRTPFTMSPDTGTSIDAQRVAGYIARLGNIPPSVVATIAAVDYLPLMTAVVDFFTDTETASLTSLAV
jgi:hypothetical protein